jgi:hypothetical protein
VCVLPQFKKRAPRNGLTSCLTQAEDSFERLMERNGAHFTRFPWNSLYFIFDFFGSWIAAKNPFI